MTMTTNPPAVVDSGTFTVRRTITIQAPMDRVWEAITDARHIAAWFGQSAILDTVAVGARGVFSFEGVGDFPVLIEELEPPRLIAYRQSNDNTRAVDPARVSPERSTVFRFALEPAGAGTQLTVVESGFDSLADPAAGMESNRGGWDAELDELVAYLEGGS
ncbi:hypothetical protein E3O42_13880 [Cryobacterium adonitolivorans]|uniref:Activator of Hsp90 ATPase homologue 1/2-like C-terminal domain-containing protein n=1 Tax=Cryobacterium adonitolivorans TaxID=1259189 RepID=A0A4R8W2Y2_9MICO|nr:SRPBCC family protein [Cryobacterium adonitolivorans]TFB99330.1 hypothetical protein E3O42_13880 [Cryobacterium adonitolivorans]